jgi:hypothetical protein
MGKFALALHPEKTRLIEFGRHAAANRKARALITSSEKDSADQKNPLTRITVSTATARSCIGP